MYTRMSGPAVLEQATRERIYGHIQAKPGVHYRSLLRDLAMANGTLAHHLRALERERLIRLERRGLKLRFYPAGLPPAEAAPDPEAEPLLPKQAALLEFVRANPGTSQARVATALGVSRQALHYHVHGLAERGLLAIEHHGRSTRLSLAQGTGARLRRCMACGEGSLAPAGAGMVTCPHCRAAGNGGPPQDPSQN
jgi:predicted transcriptional regulator